MRIATIGILLLVTACSRQGGSAPTEAAAPVAKPAAVAAPAAAATAPIPPEGAEAVDAALAEVKAFNATAAGELAVIAKDEGRIRAAASRAMEAARQGQAGRVTAARTEAERARASLVAGLSAFQTASAAQTAAVAAAMEACSTPQLTIYEGCVALIAEQALLAQNVSALGARYEAAETAWRQDRPRLDEASATVALGALR